MATDFDATAGGAIARRAAIKLVGGAALAAPLARSWAAEPAVSPEAVSALDGLGAEVVRLWPGAPPGALSKRPQLSVVNHSKDVARPDRTLTEVGEPAMVVFRPAVPNGAAILLMPGGGYEFEAFDNEGTRQAAWLNKHGITAFVLVYRLPAEGWAKRSLVPLQDAQRAMRLIRANAVDYGIDPRRVGSLGFSAGGHLSGSLLTRSTEKTYMPVDEADRLSATPLLSGMMYPVVSMGAGVTHAGSRAALIGARADAAATQAASVDRRVGPDTPAAFILHANDDTIVPVANATLMYEAMRRQDRPVALHIFENGGHGFGVNLPADNAAANWPDLFLAFAREEGLT